LPISRLGKVSAIARRVRAFLTLKVGSARGAATVAKRSKTLKRKLKSNKLELSRIRKLGAATGAVEGSERKRMKKRLQQEKLQLKRELRIAKERRAGGEEPVTGTLPDFLVIGTMKGGTTFLYHLLGRHPYIERAAAKELHYFDALFEKEDLEWYRRCFPTPKWKDGRRTITGEATPYLNHPLAPERVASVVPHVRLIALLRNPVDRAHSHYHHRVKRGLETLSFEEAIEAEEARLRSNTGKRRGDEHLADSSQRHSSYLSRGVYVDQLRRWSEFFDEEQMLVLKSEDFFARPQKALDLTFDFLGLPEWELEASQIVPKRRKKGGYERGMDPATRRYLEEYFEPHNKRLYEYLGKDLGW
jgi:hypothetical protein